MKFANGRVAICAYCVHSLNTTTLSPHEAIERKAANFRGVIEHGLINDIYSGDPIRVTRAHARFAELDAYVRLKLPAWLNRIAADDSDSKIEIKLIRAYRRGLVCRHRSFLKYPRDWAVRSLRLKDRDGYTCTLCGKRQAADGPMVLHEHHIVFRSRSGTNRAANLVTLCRACHQLQHDHPISEGGGEKEGTDLERPERTEPAPTPAVAAPLQAPPVATDIQAEPVAVVTPPRALPAPHLKPPEPPIAPTAPPAESSAWAWISMGVGALIVVVVLVIDILRRALG